MPYALKVAVSATSANQNAVTTAGVDTTSATLIVAAVGTSAATPVPTVSDSKTNTWTQLPGYGVAGTTGFTYLFWTVPTSVGLAHTFTATATGALPGIAVASYTGATVPTVPTISTRQVGQAHGAVASVLNTGVGSLTPLDQASLVITAISQGNATAGDTISAPFTIRTTVAATANGTGVSIADSIQTTPAVANPLWSWTTASFGAVAMTDFTLIPGTTSDDWAPRADIDTNKLQFFRVFYKRQDRDLASLSQKWKADAANTSVGGLTATAGTAADSTHEFYLLERAEQGKTS